MQKGLVSVVLPVCDETEFLKSAIESILAQTYKNLELLIIDSSFNQDSIKTIINQYEDKRISVFHTKKEGIAKALNYGISLSDGEFIARMDADDISLPERFEKQVIFFESNQDIEVIGTDFQVIDENDSIILEKNKMICDNDGIAARTIFVCSLAHPSVMFRRSVFEKGWKYDPKMYAEDYDLWTRLIGNIKLSNLPDVLLKYRRHGNNLSTLTSQKVLESAAASSKRCAERIFGIDKDKYLLEDFYQDFYNIEKNAEYYVRQAFLLAEIYENNNSINKAALCKELNLRWNTLMALIDIDENFSLLIPEPLISSVFFVTYFSKKLQLSDKTVLQELTKIIKNHFSLLKQTARDNKTFFIYGLGIAGKSLLEKYITAKSENKINWLLNGIVDKKNIKYSIAGTEYVSQSPEVLKNCFYDYVVISSETYFYEILNELLSIGIERNKIIRRKKLVQIFSYGSKIL